MVEIRDEGELRAWLDGRDGEVGTAIAARSALRVLPRLVEVIESSLTEPRANFVLPVIRAIASPRVAALHETRDDAIASAAFAAARAAARSVSTDNAAAESAIYAADSAAESATESAAIYAARSANSAAESSTLSVWVAVSSDASAMEAGVSPTDISTTPLWPDEPPDWVLKDWARLKTALQAAPEEDWEVWIDWYDARLRGEPANLPLERDVVLIPNKIWDAGPKEVNAEIRRSIEMHRPTGAQLRETVSPQPVVKDGKLNVQPNEAFDTLYGNEELASLPTRQRAIVRAMLEALSDDRNVSPVTVVALQEYSNELVARGARPMLSLLNDMHQIVRDEYLMLKKEKLFDSQGGLNRSFLTFTANHKMIATHFPLNVEREASISQIARESAELNQETLEILTTNEFPYQKTLDHFRHLPRYDTEELMEGVSEKEYLESNRKLKNNTREITRITENEHETIIPHSSWALGILFGTIFLSFSINYYNNSGVLGFIIGLISTLILSFIAMRVKT